MQDLIDDFGWLQQKFMIAERVVAPIEIMSILKKLHKLYRLKLKHTNSLKQKNLVIRSNANCIQNMYEAYHCI
jgi:hypothetical protein